MLSTKHPAASLTRGLPYAFRTSDAHFIPDHVRQSSNGVPVQTRLQKTFYTKDVDNITAEVEEVNSFGDGAADEWRKGMTQRGKDAMADSSRWERWEGSMPLGKALAEVLREYDLASFPRLLEQQQRQQRQVTGQYAHVNGAPPAPPFHGKQNKFSSLYLFYLFPNVCPLYSPCAVRESITRRQRSCYKLKSCCIQRIWPVTDPSHRYTPFASTCACLCQHSTSRATPGVTARTRSSSNSTSCSQCSRSRSCPSSSPC
jgi:hypothetical protein